MMNALSPVSAEGKKTMETAWNMAALDECAWVTDPLGHSRYQLEKFVLPNDNPTPDAQYRQGVRELWSRWQAYRQQTFAYTMNTEKSALLEMEAEDLFARARFRFWNRPAQRVLRQAARMKIIEAAALRENNREIVLDLEHRILRETRIILEAIGKLPKPAVDGDRESVEAENWQVRGARERLMSPNGRKQ